MNKGQVIKRVIGNHVKYEIRRQHGRQLEWGSLHSQQGKTNKEEYLGHHKKIGQLKKKLKTI